ncbi:hypothetical protein [Streptomyces sp. BHT-5-2]|nr:hypothetical protein [Streptomyces sp. BHT-5-2]
MSHAFYSFAVLCEFSRSEQSAVESVRRALEGDPEQGRGLPDADPRSEP